MKRRRVIGVLAAVPVLACGMVLGSATGAAAQSENASCVAQFVHGPPGPPGQFQSQFHLPRFGQNVSFVAHLPREFCQF